MNFNSVSIVAMNITDSISERQYNKSTVPDSLFEEDETKALRGYIFYLWLSSSADKP